MQAEALTPANDTNGSGHQQTGPAHGDHEDPGIPGNALATEFVDATGGQVAARARSVPDGAAAAEAVKHAGPTIAAAGLILAGSFASLMLAGQSTLTQMGFAISAGIAVAAFVMAMFFTPALTALIGHAAWWPGHADSATGHAEPSTSSGEPEESEPAGQLRR